MALPDISAQFVFRQWTQGKYSYKEASGELGVPGGLGLRDRHQPVADLRRLAPPYSRHSHDWNNMASDAPSPERSA